MVDMSKEYRNILFDLQRSVRYHDQRKSFFEFLHRITNVLTILMAGNVIYTLALPPSVSPPWWFTTISLIAVFLSACDLVIGYASKSNLHFKLRDRFSDLELDVREKGLQSFDLNTVRRLRVEIEKDEPPVYCALDAMCYNEVVRATFKKSEYKDYLIDIKFRHRLTRHLFQWKSLS